MLVKMYGEDCFDQQKNVGLAMTERKCHQYDNKEDTAGHLSLGPVDRFAVRPPCPISKKARTVEWPLEAESLLVWAHLDYTEESYQ